MSKLSRLKIRAKALLEDGEHKVSQEKILMGLRKISTFGFIALTGACVVNAVNHPLSITGIDEKNFASKDLNRFDQSFATLAISSRNAAIFAGFEAVNTTQVSRVIQALNQQFSQAQTVREKLLKINRLDGISIDDYLVKVRDAIALISPFADKRLDREDQKHFAIALVQAVNPVEDSRKILLEELVKNVDRDDQVLAFERSLPMFLMYARMWTTAVLDQGEISRPMNEYRFAISEQVKAAENLKESMPRNKWVFIDQYTHSLNNVSKCLDYTYTVLSMKQYWELMSKALTEQIQLFQAIGIDLDAMRAITTRSIEEKEAPSNELEIKQFG